MNPAAKTTNQRKADERARKRERGLIKVEYWIRPEHKDKLNRYVKRLSAP
jgi:two-component SAPR family response regulator